MIMYVIKYVGQSIQSFLIPKLCKFYVKYIIAISCLAMDYDNLMCQSDDQLRAC